MNNLYYITAEVDGKLEDFSVTAAGLVEAWRKAYDHLSGHDVKIVKIEEVG